MINNTLTKPRYAADLYVDMEMTIERDTEDVTTVVETVLIGPVRIRYHPVNDPGPRDVEKLSVQPVHPRDQGRDVQFGGVPVDGSVPHLTHRYDAGGYFIVPIRPTPCDPTRSAAQNGP